jgi:hypothetical protein
VVDELNEMIHLVNPDFVINWSLFEKLWIKFVHSSKEVNKEKGRDVPDR